MAYLIDANVFYSAYAPLPDDELHKDYQRLLQKKAEALIALEKLKEEQQERYHTEEILKEVENAVQRKKENDGLGLSPEQAKAVINEIKEEAGTKSLEEKLKEELKGKGLEEQQAIKVAQEKAEKAALEKAEKALEVAIKDKKIDESTNELEHAKEDVRHAAKAEAHGLTILTSNVKDFKIHEGIKVEHTRAVALDLEPERVKDYDKGGIALPTKDSEYFKENKTHQTQTYKVELASGKTAYINIKREKDAPYNARDTIYNAEVIDRLEREGSSPQNPIREIARRGDEIIAKKAAEIALDQAATLAIGAAGGGIGVGAYEVAKAAKQAKETLEPKKELPEFDVVVQVDGRTYSLGIPAANEKEAQAYAQRLFDDPKFLDQVREQNLAPGETLTARVEEPALTSQKTPFQRDQEKEEKKKKEIERDDPGHSR